MADKTVNLNLRVNEQTRNKLKRKARQLGVTYSELINRWINDFVGEGEDPPPLHNDKEDNKDISEQIDALRQEMEEKLESFRRDYQYNDEQYSNDIKTHLSQMEGELAKKGSAIESLQEQLRKLGEDSDKKVTTQYLDQRLAQALEVVWEQIDSSEEAEVLKIEPQSSQTESNDLKEAKKEKESTDAKYEGLTQTDLAKRLKKSPNTVKSWIKEKQDKEWSKENDPEGLIWKFDKKTTKYIPETTEKEGVSEND